MDLTGKTIAILATNYVEEAELTEPRDHFVNAGATVKVYSDSGNDIWTVQNDVEKSVQIKVDGTFEDVVVDAIDALIVPGGTVNADTIRCNVDAQEIVQQVDEVSKILAVICHGPWLLVSAGIIEGRTLTSYPSLQDDIKNAGGTWTDEEVVVDENLITSRNPEDLPAFIGAIDDALQNEEDM